MCLLNIDANRVLIVGMLMVSVKAADFAQGSIVDSSVALAHQIAQVLRAGSDITVSFAGMRGLSSSYFNPILNAVKDSAGLSVIGQRLAFQFDSKAQEIVFQRSLDAVSRA